ncbi:hypothetical protein AVEN_162088-1 [Araneus ventricosus]|uniref:Uncharacterized protein n=1 Tax=Araneus ventricosus TaxID=182803 RepID=A0A4Y2H7W7_ARAVE|nr:hypothetical protein AVEN_162088-1 [Araneus ventricosus]
MKNYTPKSFCPGISASEATIPFDFKSDDFERIHLGAQSNLAEYEFGLRTAPANPERLVNKDYLILEEGIPGRFLDNPFSDEKNLKHLQKIFPGCSETG